MTVEETVALRQAESLYERVFEIAGTPLVPVPDRLQTAFGLAVKASDELVRLTRNNPTPYAGNLCGILLHLLNLYLILVDMEQKINNREEQPPTAGKE